MKNKWVYLLMGALAITGLGLIAVPSGMRFTGYLLVCAAAAWGLGLFLRRRAKKSRTGRDLWRVYLAGLGLGLTVFLAIEGMVVFYGESDNSALPVDAVIVLGAGVNGETPSAALWTRIRAAGAYLADHPDVPVVLSGGQGPGEAITEAEAMRRELWTNSEAARYLLEEQSTNTAENFRYSRELLESHGLDTETAVIAVVTNDFHCFRARLIAQHMGLRTVSIPAELPWWWLTANYYLREAVGVVKTVLIDLR